VCVSMSMCMCLYSSMCIYFSLYIYIYIEIPLGSQAFGPARLEARCRVRQCNESSETHWESTQAEKLKTQAACKQKQKNTKTHVACNADSGAAVALSVPRSAFLADFQPAGASRRPNRGNAKLPTKKHPPCNPPWHVYVHGCMGISGIPRRSGFQGSLSTSVERALETGFSQVPRDQLTTMYMYVCV
jgi:hypothetical protein